MKNYEDSYISPWGYVGYSVLWAIPVLGWLIWLFNCFSRKTNKRNYARSIFCAFIFAFIVWAVLLAVIFLGVGIENFMALYDESVGELGLLI